MSIRRSEAILTAHRSAVLQLAAVCVANALAYIHSQRQFSKKYILSYTLVSFKLTSSINLFELTHILAILKPNEQMEQGTPKS
jgi:hypothetical protein